MRLYDKLLTIPGTLLDEAFGGAYTNLARGLRQAQCFIMSPDLASACEEICWSKPSSMLSARNMMRLPYQHTWIEWCSDDRLKETTRVNGKPRPLRMGCYVVTNEEGNKGTAHFLWEHKFTQEALDYYNLKAHPLEGSNIPDITLDPFGIIFDWTEGAEPAMLQYARYVGLSIDDEAVKARKNWSRDDYRRAMKESDKWKKLAHDEKEVEAYMELDNLTGIVPLDICQGLFTHPILGKSLRPGQKMFVDFMEDLTGEFIYLEAFLLMLNSRNSVVSQAREDLSRLNKARAKNKKSPFKEFIITDLKLNKTQTTRAGMIGISRAEARRHLVRGHFKTRASGVYWYSEHLRGHGPNSPVTRKEYRVDL